MADGVVPDRLGWHSLGTSFACDCGVVHRLPINVCHVGTDAAQRLASFANDECGKRALVVSDENTRQAAGDVVPRALCSLGKQVREHTFGAIPFDATQALGEEVKELARESDFIVAIGSGTLCDLAKYAGDKLSLPVLLYATAASMNGYTSAIVALKVRGLKRTLPCAPAIGVFGNPEVAATASTRMTAAGIGDFLSKCSSSTDWRAAHMLRDEYFCNRPREFFEGAQQSILEAAPKIGAGDAKAVGVVLEALFLSGFSMVIAGSSAPASGGEHLISHYLDMKSALFGTEHDLHGAQVGVATVHCLGLWERILQLDPETIDIEECIGAQRPQAEIEEEIRTEWGEVAHEVLGQWNEKAPNPDSLRALLRRFQDTNQVFRRDCSEDLLPAETVRDAIAAAGGPVTAEELHAPEDEYRKALHQARYIRNRFTVLDLAAYLGLD